MEKVEKVAEEEDEILNSSDTKAETLTQGPDRDLPLQNPKSKPHEDGSESQGSSDRREIFRALEVVERDSTAIAESFASLFSSLRLALSEVRFLTFNLSLPIDFFPPNCPCNLKP